MEPPQDFPDHVLDDDDVGPRQEMPLVGQPTSGYVYVKSSHLR